MDYCKKHQRPLKNRKDKKGKYCPECVRVPVGKGKNPPTDPMNLKPKSKRRPSKKGKRGKK